MGKLVALAILTKKPSTSVSGGSSRGEEYIDVVHMGHYHQFEVNRGNCIINGSVKGSDNYSLDLRYSSKPQQMIVVYGDDEEEVIHRITLK